MTPMHRTHFAPGSPGAWLLCALLALGTGLGSGCAEEAPPEVDLARPVVVTDVSVKFTVAPSPIVV